MICETNVMKQPKKSDHFFDEAVSIRVHLSLVICVAFFQGSSLVATIDA